MSDRLRVLTFDPEPPSNMIPLDNTIECTGGYLCRCAGCQIDRRRAAQRGVRPSQPLPIKHKHAA
jgi:hypothetical protein